MIIFRAAIRRINSLPVYLGDAFTSSYVEVDVVPPTPAAIGVDGRLSGETIGAICRVDWCWRWEDGAEGDGQALSFLPLFLPSLPLFAKVTNLSQIPLQAVFRFSAASLGLPKSLS